MEKNRGLPRSNILKMRGMGVGGRDGDAEDKLVV